MCPAQSIYYKYCRAISRGLATRLKNEKVGKMAKMEKIGRSTFLPFFRFFFYTLGPNPNAEKPLSAVEKCTKRSPSLLTPCTLMPPAFVRNRSLCGWGFSAYKRLAIIYAVCRITQYESSTVYIHDPNAMRRGVSEDFQDFARRYCSPVTVGCLTCRYDKVVPISVEGRQYVVGYNGLLRVALYKPYRITRLIQ